MMKPKKFRAFLRALADSGVVRVIGSYANGTANTEDHVSDLDLYVLREDKGMKKVIAIFDAFGVPWESFVFGHIYSPRDLTTLPFPVECAYWWFDCKRGRTKPVKVFGVKFIGYVQ